MPGNLSYIYQSMLKDAGVGSVLADGQIVFRHDLLREAVATVASAVKGFESRARQVADNLFSVSPLADEVKVRAIRVKIFALLPYVGRNVCLLRLPAIEWQRCGVACVV
jgi:hypothetical protein